MDDKQWSEFQKNVEKVGKCEVWTGPGFGEKGVGVCKIGEVRLLAHRAAFIQQAGYIPTGRVLQSCKNKRCVTYEHLADEG